MNTRLQETAVDTSGCCSSGSAQDERALRALTVDAPLANVPGAEGSVHDVMGLVEEYGQWLWDCGYFDSPTGETLVDDAATRRQEIREAIERLQQHAYAEGRADEAEGRTVAAPVAWRLDRKPSFGTDIRDAMGSFYATSEATVREYVTKGWKAVPLYEQPATGEAA